MIKRGDGKKHNDSQTELIQRFVDAEGEMLLRWERVKQGRAMIGSLQPDKIHVMPKAAQLLATDMFLADLDDLRAAVFEYGEAQRARHYGS